MFNIKLSPEVFFMLPAALILDLAGILIPFLALDDYGILDITGIMIFYPWLLIRGHRPPSLNKKKRIGKIQKLFRGKKSRVVMPLFEFIPLVGMLPMWLLLVFFNIKKD